MQRLEAIQYPWRTRTREGSNVGPGFVELRESRRFPAIPRLARANFFYFCADGRGRSWVVQPGGGLCPACGIWMRFPAEEHDLRGFRVIDDDYDGHVTSHGLSERFLFEEPTPRQASGHMYGSHARNTIQDKPLRSLAPMNLRPPTPHAGMRRGISKWSRGGQRSLVAPACDCQ